MATSIAVYLYSDYQSITGNSFGDYDIDTVVHVAVQTIVE